MDMFTLLWILLIGVMLLYYFLRKGATGVKNISAAEFQQELAAKNNKILIDVRSPHEFQSGHIPTAVNIPVHDLGNRIGELANDKTIFIYCQSGMRSRQAGRILSKHGFTDIINLSGGIMSWRGKVQRS